MADEDTVASKGTTTPEAGEIHDVNQALADEVAKLKAENEALKRQVAAPTFASDVPASKNGGRWRVTAMDEHKTSLDIECACDSSEAIRQFRLKSGVDNSLIQYKAVSLPPLEPVKPVDPPAEKKLKSSNKPV